MLALVLPGRYGRWLTAFLLLTLGIAVFWFSGIFSASSAEISSEVKSAALFFCVVNAYIVPVFHYITERSDAALAAVLPQFLDPDGRLPPQYAELRSRIQKRTLGWQLGGIALATFLWLVQSWLLSGGGAGMIAALTGSSEAASMALGALPVWLFIMCAIQALANNANLFHQLAREVPIDLFHTRPLMEFGRVAVVSVVAVIGVQALFSIMFFGGVDSIWATGPGLLLTTLAMLYLLVAPVKPLHSRLQAAKLAALEDVESEIAGRSDKPLAQRSDSELDRFTNLLEWRDEVRKAPEWPFDLDLIARLAIYLVLVPLTWVGAALIENVVDLVLD